MFDPIPINLDLDTAEYVTVTYLKDHLEFIKHELYNNTVDPDTFPLSQTDIDHNREMIVHLNAILHELTYIHGEESEYAQEL